MHLSNGQMAKVGQTVVLPGEKTGVILSILGDECIIGAFSDTGHFKTKELTLTEDYKPAKKSPADKQTDMTPERLADLVEESDAEYQQSKATLPAKFMRAKLQVETIKNVYEGAQEIVMSPVCGNGQYGPNGESEDNTFSHYTPCGEVRLTISNPELVGKFKIGQTFYADFIETE